VGEIFLLKPFLWFSLFVLNIFANDRKKLVQSKEEEFI